MKEYLRDDHGFDDNKNMSKFTAIDLITEKCNLKNRKIFINYWESPVGTFQWDFSKAGEIGYIIEGEMALVNNTGHFNLLSGDCYYFEIGEIAMFEVKKFTRMIIINLVADKGLQIYFQEEVNRNLIKPH